jgi:hypothetical protein
MIGKNCRGVRALGAALVVVASVTAFGAAFAQRSDCKPLRMEWNQGVLSQTSAKLEGFVYNDSVCSLGRGYFALPLPLPSAARYRIDVESFDEVMGPNSQAP